MIEILINSNEVISVVRFDLLEGLKFCLKGMTKGIIETRKYIYQMILDFTKSVNHTNEDLTGVVETASVSDLSSIRKAVTAMAVTTSTAPSEAKMPKRIFGATLPCLASVDDIVLRPDMTFFLRLA